ncbi:MAG: thiamine pyrophosphate-dependent enzyme [Candidatus Alcyoniella australis]|nr:thiamine pyrophosphate-dependent enzyme [Candidatus Alcyoniella australis]
MSKVFSRPESLLDTPLHYCPGCGHSIIHRLIAEVIDELQIRERAILVPPAGCAVLAYNYLDVDAIEAAHGRASAVATGLKRLRPDCVVFTYQGDGDLAAIGIAESIHAANRSEKITVIYVNNAVYGMTGGQMAPTTMIGQKTTTTPFGRDVDQAGYPILICEMLSQLPGATYLERTSVHDAKHILRTRKAIKRAFEVQLAGQGFSLVEVLSPCPTNWHLTPAEAHRHVPEQMVKTFRLGVFREPGDGRVSC